MSLQADKKNNPADSPVAEDDSMLQIRELLFGEQQRDNQEHFQQTSEQINRLAEHTEQENRQLQTRLEDAASEITAKLDRQQATQEQALTAGLHRLQQTFDQKLESLQNKMQQDHTHLTDNLAQAQQQLQTDKVNREQLAALLHQVAAALENKAD